MLGIGNGSWVLGSGFGLGTSADVWDFWQEGVLGAGSRGQGQGQGHESGEQGARSKETAVFADVWVHEHESGEQGDDGVC